MNTLDIVIFIIIVSSFVRGIFKGFVMELATLVALILGIIGAVLFSGVVANWISKSFEIEYIAIISFIILLVGIILSVYIVAKIIDKFLKVIALGWLNRIAGGFFAVLKVMFFVSILILAFDFFGLGTKIISKEKREKSFLFSPVERFAPSVLDLLNLDYEHLLPEKKTKPQYYIVKL